MSSSRCLFLVLVTVGAALCYRAPNGGSGSYTLPNIGKYPAPQPTFPKNFGLPDAYKHTRTFRSVDAQLPAASSVGQIGGPQDFRGPVEELSRVRRYSEPRIILPTYRPPPRRRPPIIYA